MSRLTDKTCDYDAWRTPERVLEVVRDAFSGEIPLDPATSPDNPTRAARFYTTEGLDAPWDVPYVFVNPPYGRALRLWVRKIAVEAAAGRKIVALLPANRFEQEYWQQDALCPFLSAMVFVRRRLRFVRPDGTEAAGNPYASILYCYNLSDDKTLKLAPLGRVLLLRR